GVKHHVLDLTQQFEEKIIEPFCDEYASGRTPNPCVHCNYLIKFGALLDKISELGGKKLATGHYARLEQQHDLYHLYQGVDQKKDQSYFLYRLIQPQLSRINFPLGEWMKNQTREYFKKLSIPAVPAESQDICFIPEGNYRDFIKKRLGTLPGNIVNRQGDVLGQHLGLAFYTIGQRHGLGLSFRESVYVVGMNPYKDELIVGDSIEQSSHFTLGDLSWIIPEPPIDSGRLEVKLRYQTAKTPVKRLTTRQEYAEFELEKPVPSVAPGQSAVFYLDNEVIGGGIIEPS